MRPALGFLTVVGGATAPDERAPRWYAPIGALIGLALGAAWWGADQLWPPLLAAVLVVALDAALTGMLHLDGLADCGDGLIAPMDRSRRLAVMRDPGVGAFGVVVLVVVLVARVGTLAELAPDAVLLAGLWAASRGMMALVLVTVPYARTQTPAGGLASAFHPTTTSRRSTILAAGGGALLALVAVVLTAGLPAGPAVAAGLVVGGSGVVLLAYRRLGGFTGDVLGAAGVVGETCGLLLAAAQW